MDQAIWWIIHLQTETAIAGLDIAECLTLSEEQGFYLVVRLATRDELEMEGFYIATCKQTHLSVKP